MEPSLSRRKMGGGPYPYNLGVKKNKFIEEWNGRREITEKSFNASGKTVPWIITLCIVLPYGVYSVVRDELTKTGGRRYKEMV